MDIEHIEKGFCSYIDKVWKLSDVTPFLLAYIDLLLLFRNELSETRTDVLLKRQSELRGEAVQTDGFEELRKSSRNEMDAHLKDNTDDTRAAMLNRLLFCALLDSEENDLFYLTEPMFEFVQKMQVSPDQLKRILEAEFVGFKI